MPPGQHVYRLRSVASFYGKHYSAVVLRPEHGGWWSFDDAVSGLVRLPTSGTRGGVLDDGCEDELADGSWAAVRLKGRMGRLQPSVCFYERI